MIIIRKAGPSVYVEIWNRSVKYEHSNKQRWDTYRATNYVVPVCDCICR